MEEIPVEVQPADDDTIIEKMVEITTRSSQIYGHMMNHSIHTEERRASILDKPTKWYDMTLWVVRPVRWMILFGWVSFAILVIRPSNEPVFSSTFFRWFIQPVNKDQFFVWTDDCGVFILLNTMGCYSVEVFRMLGINVMAYNKLHYIPLMADTFALSSRQAWAVIYAPPSIIAFMCLLYCMIDQGTSQGHETTGVGVITCFILFMHFSKRMLEEQYTQHGVKMIGIESWTVIPSFYSLAVWTICKASYEINRPFNHPFVVFGVLLWFFATLGNSWVHIMLSKIDRPVKPDGSLGHVKLEEVSCIWRYINKPNYWFDWLQWVAVWFLSSSPAAVIYLLFIPMNENLLFF